MRTDHYMKRRIFVMLLPVMFMLVSLSPQKPGSVDPAGFIGAWQYGPEDNHTVMIIVNHVFTVATYDLPGRKFISSYGGTWKMDGDKFVQKLEWHSLSPDRAGQETALAVKIKDNKLIVPERKETWDRIRESQPNEITGAWVITGNYRDGQPFKRSSPFYPRRTMKVLGGGRFQWIAYNVDTHKFENTGGGTYTASNAKYTETIEFFTKTAESVGKHLQFEYSLVDGEWRHKGEKSTGGPMDEIWTRRETLESGQANEP
jgi:hypothetical protein